METKEPFGFFALTAFLIGKKGDNMPNPVELHGPSREKWEQLGGALGIPRHPVSDALFSDYGGDRFH